MPVYTRTRSPTNAKFASARSISCSAGREKVVQGRAELLNHRWFQHGGQHRGTTLKLKPVGASPVGGAICNYNNNGLRGRRGQLTQPAVPLAELGAVQTG